MTAGDATAAGVSVVVPAYGVADRVTRQLDALAPQVVACGGEIVVVDDASPDDTGGVAAAWAVDHPSVRCTVVRARRRGFANASRNAGAGLATGGFLAFTDGDDVARPDWLERLCAARTPRTLLAGRICYTGRPVQSMPAFHRLPLGLAPGSSMAFGREVFDLVGGFDETITYGGNEVEFCLTAQLVHGVGLREVPSAVVDCGPPGDRSHQRRRQMEIQAGSAVIARRVRRIPGAPDPGFRVRGRVRGMAGSAVRMVTGGGRGRSGEADRLWIETAALVAIARGAVAPALPRRFDPVAVAVDYVVLHGRG